MTMNGCSRFLSAMPRCSSFFDHQDEMMFFSFSSKSSNIDMSILKIFQKSRGHSKSELHLTGLKQSRADGNKTIHN